MRYEDVEALRLNIVEEAIFVTSAMFGNALRLMRYSGHLGNRSNPWTARATQGPHSSGLAKT